MQAGWAEWRGGERRRGRKREGRGKGRRERKRGVETSRPAPRSSPCSSREAGPLWQRAPAGLGPGRGRSLGLILGAGPPSPSHQALGSPQLWPRPWRLAETWFPAAKVCKEPFGLGSVRDGTPKLPPRLSSPITLCAQASPNSSSLFLLLRQKPGSFLSPSPFAVKDFLSGDHSSLYAFLQASDPAGASTSRVLAVPLLCPSSAPPESLIMLLNTYHASWLGQPQLGSADP